MMNLGDKIASEFTEAVRLIDWIDNIKTIGLSFAMEREPEGLRVRTCIESDTLLLPLAPNESVVSFEQKFVEEDDCEAHVLVTLTVADPWKSFQKDLGWEREGPLVYRLQVTDHGMLISQDGEWYAIEGLIPSTLKPEQFPRPNLVKEI